MWDDETDKILEGDLCTVLGYITGAGGVVLTAMSPIGLRDREAGTISFATALAFGKKLDRMGVEPRVAMAYHTRDHGIVSDATNRYVLVQGQASFDTTLPSKAEAMELIHKSEPYLGPPKTGVFWNWWLSAYYRYRIVVTVKIDRLTSWPDLSCGGTPETLIGDDAGRLPDPQSPPKKGVGPRIDVANAHKQLEEVPHHLLGYRGADGFPEIFPVWIGSPTDEGLPVTSDHLLPSGGCRAGLLGHDFGPRDVGLKCRQYTGWLQDGVYSPHTERGLVAPKNRTLTLLGNGLMARRGYKKWTEQEARRTASASV